MTARGERGGVPDLERQGIAWLEGYHDAKAGNVMLSSDADYAIGFKWGTIDRLVEGPRGTAVAPIEPNATMRKALDDLAAAMVPGDAHERDMYCLFALKAYRAMVRAHAVSAPPRDGAGAEE